MKIRHLQFFYFTIVAIILLLPGRILAKTIPASELQLLGRGWSTAEVYSVKYGRVPARLIDTFGSNENAKGQSRCSSGLCFFFSTNSRSIGAVYKPWLNHVMNHQAETGTRGLDLYIYDTERGEWVYLSTHKPDAKHEQTVDFFVKLDGSFHDFLLYLPLYDSVTDFSLVVDDDALMRPGNTAYCDPDKRVLVYGTSITQGGCATRTGMAGSSILGRKLKCQTFNFGFSAGGWLDAGSAKVFAEIKNVSVYVIDAVANASPLTIQTNLYEFVRILHEANPKASFVFVDGLSPNFTFYTSGNDGYQTANERLRQMVEYVRGIFKTTRFEIVPESIFDDAEGEATVDSYHYTDLGYVLWARGVASVVADMLK